MSRLVITGKDNAEFTLNVTQFRSPMSAAINSVQTHTMLQHFPIRCGQPDIEFTCIFASYDDKHKFQNFVRDHQTNAISDPDGEVTLWWPERNIENWTGYISSFQVVERRFEIAPKVTFGIDLIDSLMSEKTTLGSSASPFDAIFGNQIGPYAQRPDLIDSILALPSTIIGTATASNGVNDSGGLFGIF